MLSAHPGGCGSAPKQTTSVDANTKTATGNFFNWAEFGTDAGFDVRPPDRRRQHPSAMGYGHP